MADKKTASSLFLRTASALVLAPVVLVVLYFGSPYFEILVALGAIILVLEWRTMIAKVGAPLRLWAVGIAYIALPCLALLWLRGGEAGRDTVFWLFAVVWAADSGAYFFGRAIGGPKMAPRISPKKTWAGLIGGLITAGSVGLAVSVWVISEGWPSNALMVIVLSVFVGFIAEMGDLLESWIKRRLDVKDSGRLIPGHGGLFDRVDGLFAAAVVTAIIGWADKGSIVLWF